MGIFFRKSIKLGQIPHRAVFLNVSKSGLGVSAGIKGARIGISSTGRKYLSGGRYGIYYRQNLPETESEPEISLAVWVIVVLGLAAMWAIFFI